METYIRNNGRKKSSLIASLLRVSLIFAGTSCEVTHDGILLYPFREDFVLSGYMKS